MEKENVIKIQDQHLKKVKHFKKVKDFKCLHYKEI